MEVGIKKMTVAEFREIEYDDSDTNWYELLDGELMKRDGSAFRAPTPEHQRLVRRLIIALDAYINAHQLGEVLSSPIDVFLDDVNVPQPDLVFVATDQLSIITKNGIEGVPRLVVEIISPTSIVRDRINKKALYEQAGVAEYWLVDPQNGEIEIYGLSDSARYELISAASVTEGALKSKVFATLSINLSALFA